MPVPKDTQHAVPKKEGFLLHSCVFEARNLWISFNLRPTFGREKYHQDEPWIDFCRKFFRMNPQIFGFP